MTAAAHAPVVPLEAGHVLRLVDTLAPWVAAGVPVLARLWPCPRCKAPVGVGCMRPSGAPYVPRDLERDRKAWLRRYGPGAVLPPDLARPRHHAPRTDRGIRAVNTTPIKAWRADVLTYGIRPSVVMREIRRSYLYRRLETLHLLGSHPSAWVAGGSA